MKSSVEHCIMICHSDNYSNGYNIITLEREKTIEFYLEKIGFGNLFFVAGRDKSSKSFGCINNLVSEAIEAAEQQNFWGEE